MAGLKRVQRRQRVPVVLTREEVAALLAQLDGTARLMCELIYGAGLRVHECVTLRVKDLDLAAKTVSVRNSKGSKDRSTVLAESLVPHLQAHLARVATLHAEDRLRGGGLVPMPDALSRKYPSAAASFAWQFVFSAGLALRIALSVSGMETGPWGYTTLEV